ncbi:hypothetical protein SLS60_008604 [Paraconiothyrium brasiliense]|uniref:Uncharacterized protein n=1 Tax=Paraconiothyrium brasiliense TaxID=300254 RepID=A0ABR3QY02_9PLEO
MSDPGAIMARHAFTPAESTHAHPSTPPMPRTPERYNSMTERLWSMYGKGLYADGLQLRGLPGEDRSTAAEVYCPDVRRSGFNNNLSINHLDVVSCWKGLNLQQAEEVLTWERIFRKALEELIVGASAPRRSMECHRFLSYCNSQSLFKFNW